MLSYFSPDLRNFNCKEVAVKCRLDLIKFCVELFKTYSDNIELLWFEKGTIIFDDEYLFIDENTNLSMKSF